MSDAEYVEKKRKWILAIAEADVSQDYKEWEIEKTIREAIFHGYMKAVDEYQPLLDEARGVPGSNLEGEPGRRLGVKGPDVRRQET